MVNKREKKWHRTVVEKKVSSIDGQKKETCLASVIRGRKNFRHQWSLGGKSSRCESMSTKNTIGSQCCVPPALVVSVCAPLILMISVCAPPYIGCQCPCSSYIGHQCLCPPYIADFTVIPGHRATLIGSVFFAFDMRCGCCAYVTVDHSGQLQCMDPGHPAGDVELVT